MRDVRKEMEGRKVGIVSSEEGDERKETEKE